MSTSTDLPWMAESEFLSAQRKATTGNAVVRDAQGQYIGTVKDVHAGRIVAAANLSAQLVDTLRTAVDDMEKVIAALPGSEQAAARSARPWLSTANTLLIAHDLFSMANKSAPRRLRP